MNENGVITENDLVLITKTQMLGLFLGVTKPEMINLVTETIPKMSKTGYPFFNQIRHSSLPKCITFVLAHPVFFI